MRSGAGANCSTATAHSSHHAVAESQSSERLATQDFFDMGCRGPNFTSETKKGTEHMVDHDAATRVVVCTVQKVGDSRRQVQVQPTEAGAGARESGAPGVGVECLA